MHILPTTIHRFASCHKYCSLHAVLYENVASDINTPSIVETILIIRDREKNPFN